MHAGGITGAAGWLVGGGKSHGCSRRAHSAGEYLGTPVFFFLRATGMTILDLVFAGGADGARLMGGLVVEEEEREVSVAEMVEELARSSTSMTSVPDASSAKYGH
jgi:hypothetical protein